MDGFALYLLKILIWIPLLGFLVSMWLVPWWYVMDLLAASVGNCL